jgi:hypothetical protein
MTAVEWLEEKIKANPFRIENDRLWDEANEMYKEQIIEFAVSCLQSNSCFFDIEEYYNKTFKQQEQ